MRFISWRESTALYQVGSNTIPLMQDDHGRVNRLRIMRMRLRQVLLEKVPPGCLHFGKMCLAAIPGTGFDSTVRLAFADSTEAQCDLLVVADGANSKLRTTLLPNEKNRYTGVCMLAVSLLPQVNVSFRSTSTCKLLKKCMVGDNARLSGWIMMEKHVL